MARKKALNKDIRVEIKKSLGRYISIFLIVEYVFVVWFDSLLALEKLIYNPKTKPSKAISPIPTTFQSKIFVLKNLFTNFIYILLYSYFFKNN